MCWRKHGAGRKLAGHWWYPTAPPLVPPLAPPTPCASPIRPRLTDGAALLDLVHQDLDGVLGAHRGVVKPLSRHVCMAGGGRGRGRVVGGARAEGSLGKSPGWQGW